MTEPKQKVLITGASGRIGTLLRTHWQTTYDLVLIDKQPDPTDTRVLVNDFSDLSTIQPLFEGVDTVIHLANDGRTTASWESLLPNNIITNYNVFEAAHQANCKRVIFASSVNAVAGYPADVQVKTDMPVAPPNLYGTTKVFGEALGRYYADQKGLNVQCLRLGVVLKKNDERITKDYPLLDILLTFDDLIRLFDACMAATHIQFGVFHGTSDNRFKRLDISDTKERLNYHPQDDAYVIAGIMPPERPDHLFESR